MYNSSVKNILYFSMVLYFFEKNIFKFNRTTNDTDETLFCYSKSGLTDWHALTVYTGVQISDKITFVAHVMCLQYVFFVLWMHFSMRSALYDFLPAIIVLFYRLIVTDVKSTYEVDII
jgi:hypothetical protein